MRPGKDRHATDFESDSEVEELSKTKKKQQSAELQHLGQELSKLSSATLDSMDLDSELRVALDEAQRIKAGGALKRQIKFIGGLLRDRDAEPIREKLAGLKNQSNAATRKHHILENWRDRLLAEGDTVVCELMEQIPEIDSQHLRQLIRSAKKELELGKAPRASRELYRYLREYFD